MVIFCFLFPFLRVASCLQRARGHFDQPFDQDLTMVPYTDPIPVLWVSVSNNKSEVHLDPSITHLRPQEKIAKKIFYFKIKHFLYIYIYIYIYVYIYIYIFFKLKSIKMPNYSNVTLIGPGQSRPGRIWQ